MISRKNLISFLTILTLGLSIFWTGESILLKDAHAIVGRPLTPVSYAGVARRTTRRAAYTGAAYGAATVYPYSHSSTSVYVGDDDFDDDDCVVTVNAYGNMYKRCDD